MQCNRVVRVNTTLARVQVTAENVDSCRPPVHEAARHAGPSAIAHTSCSTRSNAKPVGNPPGYPHSRLLIIVNWSWLIGLPASKRSTCTSCRRLRRYLANVTRT